MKTQRPCAAALLTAALALGGFLLAAEGHATTPACCAGSNTQLGEIDWDQDWHLAWPGAQNCTDYEVTVLSDSGPVAWTSGAVTWCPNSNRVCITLIEDDKQLKPFHSRVCLKGSEACIEQDGSGIQDPNTLYTTYEFRGVLQWQASCVNIGTQNGPSTSGSIKTSKSCVVPPTTLEVPSLSTVGLAVLAFVLAAAGIYLTRRTRPTGALGPSP